MIVFQASILGGGRHTDVDQHRRQQREIDQVNGEAPVADRDRGEDEGSEGSHIGEARWVCGKGSG